MQRAEGRGDRGARVMDGASGGEGGDKLDGSPMASRFLKGYLSQSQVMIVFYMDV